jgi:hypothetical protein
MLWQKAKAMSVRPSELMGLEPDSYEAWCLDEAIVYFGLVVENKLEEVGSKPSKEERRAKAAREAMLNKLFSPEEAQASGFADPALMFQ